MREEKQSQEAGIGMEHCHGPTPRPWLEGKEEGTRSCPRSETPQKLAASFSGKASIHSQLKEAGDVWP